MPRYQGFADDGRSYGLYQHVRDALGRFSKSRQEVADAKRTAQRDASLARMEAQQGESPKKIQHLRYGEGGTLENGPVDEFEHSHENALHYSHYEKHYPKLVGAVANLHGMSHHQAAVSIAGDVNDTFGDDWRNTHGEWGGAAGQNKLGARTAREAREELRDHGIRPKEEEDNAS